MGGLKKIPQVTFILLLMVVKTCLNCKNFEYNPISSEYKDHIEALKKKLLLDYRTETITNLKEDSLCSNIWNLYFHERELERLYNVSGSDLKSPIDVVLRELNFTKDCTFNVSKDCVIGRKLNISVFLDNVSTTMEKMKNSSVPIDLSYCSDIQCDTDAVITMPFKKNSDEVTPPIGLPDKDIQGSDKSQEASRQHWLLVSIVCVESLIITVTAILYSLKHCRRTGQQPDSERGEQQYSETVPLDDLHPVEVEV